MRAVAFCSRVFWGIFPLKKFVLACGVAAAALSLSACATITRGSSQKFSVDTTPTQAAVKLSTGQTCVSPCQLNLKRKHGFTVTASKQGYENSSAIVDSRIRGGGVAGGAGNIIAGGLIGIAVDASSGAMNDLTPNPLHLNLKPVAVAAAPDAAPIGAVGAAASALGTAPVDGSTNATPAADVGTAPTAEAAPVAAPVPGTE